MLAAHPVDPQRQDAFWLVGGRLVDWGAAPDDTATLDERSEAALRRGGRAGELGAHVPPTEIDELRIVSTYLASHPETTQLVLRGTRRACPGLERELGDLADDVAAVGDRDGAPGRGLAADQREPDRAEPRRLRRRSRAAPTTRPSNDSSSPDEAGADSRSPRNCRFGLPR